jgi:hypothetical protein
MELPVTVADYNDYSVTDLDDNTQRIHFKKQGIDISIFKMNGVHEFTIMRNQKTNNICASSRKNEWKTRRIVVSADDNLIGTTIQHTSAKEAFNSDFSWIIRIPIQT